MKVITMWLTNKCNLHCIMCPFVLKEYENRTYYNEAPFFATVKSVKKILPRYALFSKKHEKEQQIEFDFFMGETLLNPSAMDIFKYVKKRYPKSKIAVLSNGTVPPPHEEMAKYIDVLGFSLDGGTKEVFESIRTPANFEHVIKTIKMWLKAQKNYNPDLLIRTSTTLSTLNIADLPNIVEVVGQVVEETGGKWDSVYCQPIVIEDYQNPELKKTTLENVPNVIYNSKGYWQLRKDLLEGKLKKECRNCTIGKSEYYRLRAELEKSETC